MNLANDDDDDDDDGDGDDDDADGDDDDDNYQLIISTIQWNLDLTKSLV